MGNFKVPDFGFRKARKTKNVFKKYKVKQQVFEIWGKKCYVCGSEKNLTIHHIKPKSRGGSNDINNFIPLCRSCHDDFHKFLNKVEKGTHDWDYYFEKLEEFKINRNLLSSIARSKLFDKYAPLLEDIMEDIYNFNL